VYRQRKPESPRRHGKSRNQSSGVTIMAGDVDKLVMGEIRSSLDPVAIIGMACVFPQAPDMPTFWRNIIAGTDAVGEPSAAWDAGRYLKSGRIKTPYGGYLKDLYRFDPREFGIMPSSLDGGEPDQFLALRVARDALLDAGYLGGDYDHRDTGIILGHSTYLHRGQGTLIQNHIVLDQTIELLKAACPLLDEDRLVEIRKLLESRLPQSSADIAPGLVPNVMTGRIANRLNLKGPNYLIDAACSSSLLAVNAAVDELRTGRSRMMLAGGVNASLPAEVAVIFTQLGALSGRGKVRPFETGSDGTLLGEGLGVVVLKRLSEALADGDRVYAVICGIGQASDGRGHGLLAPSVEGETLAIQRAYRSSGIAPASVGLIEAHGTGIPLGDKTEIAALKTVFGERQGASGNVALGSVKSMISHCIPAAGIAGLIKSALALHHKILPPTLCESVNPELGIESTPFYINTQASPWISRIGAPRRAGINSFGFGGINAHAIIEEAPTQALKPKQYTAWPAELCVFSADSKQALTDRLTRLASGLKANPDWRLAEVAAALTGGDANGDHRLAIIAKDTDDLARNIGRALKQLRDNDAERWSTRGGIVYSNKPLAGKLAFLFPGEGSQYLGMFADLAMCFDEVRGWFDFWRSLYNDAPGATRTDIVFPPLAELTAQRRAELEKRLNDMDVGSEAVFIGGQAMYALLRSLGVDPDVMVGHSSGESSALAASGAIAAANPLQLAEFIRRLNKVYRQVLEDGKIPTGALLTVGALPLSTVEEHMAAASSDIVIAMDNCANQQVLYGDRRSIDAIQKSLGAAGGICLPLPFDRGYHTPAFAEASKAFLEYYRNIKLQHPQVPLYSCASADLFPDAAEAVRQLAASQWSTKVRFRETLAKMHNDGVRYFIEVGPSGNLTGFVNDILTGKEHVSLATNLRRRGGPEQLLTVLAHLYVNGKQVKLEKLYSPRFIPAIDLASTAPTLPLGVLLDNTMPVLRMGDSERASLQRLAAPPPAARLAEAQGGSEKREVAAQPEAQRHVMADYFDVMRGFLDQQRSVLESWQTGMEYRPQRSPATEDHTGFLDSIFEHDEQHLAATCRLSLYSDDFIKDHVLSGPVSVSDQELFGLSCIPLTVSLEIMAEACALLAGNVAVSVIENIKAFDWIALDNGEITLEVHASVIDRERKIYNARLLNDQGIALSADFGFLPEARIPGLPALKEKRISRWNGSELYTTGMFHGPVFQSIRHIDGWDDTGIDAQLSTVSLSGFFTKGETPRLVLNPVLLDAMGQLAAYWIAQQVGTDFNCFPSTIERIELYRQCPADMPGLTLRARQHSLDAATDDVAAPRAWQFECLDPYGQPQVRVTNLVNVFFPVPHRFYQVRRDPLNSWLGHVAPAAARQDIVLWELPNLAEDFCTQSGGIFLRILAHVYLSFDERSEWQDLTTTVRRRREWLLGRACIKEAVRHWIFEQTGRLLFPSDIVILHDDAGAPYVDGWWRDSLVPAPEVSLSHNRRACLAAIAGPQNPVGVDVEEVGRIQQPELIVESLTPREQTSVRGLDGAELDEKLLRIWCAKEAAAKFLGLGLQGRPAAFEVSFADHAWEAACVDYADTTVEVAVNREGDSIIALATGQRSVIEVE
jgi:acyl transferase domain-containing protein/phosphopantetheinyl transferase